MLYCDDFDLLDVAENIVLEGIEGIEISEISRPDENHVAGKTIDHINRGEDERFHSIIYEFTRSPHFLQVFAAELNERDIR